MNPDHPIQEFCFFLPEDTDKEMINELNLSILQLASKREWVIGPPEPFEEDSEDAPGGYLEIYSALGPLQLPREIDERHFQEVSLLVQHMEEFSGRHKLSIEFYLDSKLVGEIEDGRQDILLKRGLLGEWQKALETVA